ncbi:MAG: CsgG/HfaB family protein [candidate division Zixibacteria bacterium]|nr:CsgG/HfaB family protein [candidate division Zixibacteria bacterium]
MRRTIITGMMLSVFLVGVLLVGTTVADVEENLTYQGNKARITVGKIKPKADHCSYDMAASIGEMLSSALTNTGRFIVLASQEEVAELADEIDLGQSGYTEEGRGPEKGLMEGADILVTGAVTAFEPNAGGGGGGLGGLTKKAFGKFGVSKKSAKIQMEIKLIDIRTRRILKAMSLEGKSDKWKTSMGGGGRVDGLALAGGLGVYSNEPMESAIRVVLAKAIDKVSKEVPKEYYRYTGQGQYTKQYGQSSQEGGQTATSSQGSGDSQSSTASAPASEDMTLYTKYNFVPGNKVIYYDDLKGEEEGEFPYRWNLDNGVFEIVLFGKEYWIMCTDGGSIRPKIKDAPLPPKYTVELEFYSYGGEKNGSNYSISWVNNKGKNIGEFLVRGYGLNSTKLRIQGKRLASKAIPYLLPKGVHTMRIMATTRSIKCFIDKERVANVPNVEGFNPVGFRLNIDPEHWANKKEVFVLFRGFRFAEGGKSMRDQLDEDGKIVTHGILFDPDSYTIKGESFKTLKNIARLLEDDSSLRLSIEGHTDSDGSNDHNMTLSKNRASSVRTYLSSKYGISADRLEAKGWGESKSIDTNDSSEGKANNRRVELIKL